MKTMAFKRVWIFAASFASLGAPAIYLPSCVELGVCSKFDVPNTLAVALKCPFWVIALFPYPSVIVGMENGTQRRNHQFLISTTGTRWARFQWNMPSTGWRNCMYDCLLRRLKHYLWLSKKALFVFIFHFNFRMDNLSEKHWPQIHFS